MRHWESEFVRTMRLITKAWTAGFITAEDAGKLLRTLIGMR